MVARSDRIEKEISKIESRNFTSIDEAMRELLVMLKDCGFITKNCYKSMCGMLKSKRSSRYAVLKYIRRFMPRVGVIPRQNDFVDVVFIRGGGIVAFEGGQHNWKWCRGGGR